MKHTANLVANISFFEMCTDDKTDEYDKSDAAYYFKLFILYRTDDKQVNQFHDSPPDPSTCVQCIQMQTFIMIFTQEFIDVLDNPPTVPWLR